MNLAQLKNKRAALVRKLEDVKAIAGDVDSMTDEQGTEMEGLLEEIKAVDAEIAKAEARQAAWDAAADVEPVADDSTDSTRQAAPAGSERITDVRTVAEQRADRGFARGQDFMRAVMNAGSNGQNADPRLRPLHVRPSAAVGSDEHSGNVDHYGGFLIPEAHSPNFLTTPSDADPAAGRTTVLPMSSPVLNIPARTDKDHSTSVSGGLTVSRKQETAAATASRMEMERVRLQAYSVFGLSYATEELLADSPISFAAIVAAGFQEEFLSNQQKERLNGTGVGEWLGVNNSPAKISIAKETSQTADTIVYANIVKMRARCWGYQNAIWMANHDCLPTLMQMNNDNNQLIWQPSAREGEPDMLLGRPIFFNEYMETVGDQGDINLVNWKEYLNGDLQPLQSAESIHVRFVNHERAFKLWKRDAGTP